MRGDDPPPPQIDAITPGRPPSEPFELELDAVDEDGEHKVVVFADPNKLPTGTAFDLAEDEDPKSILEKLLGPFFREFWAEWQFRPIDETNELIEDAMDHYGAGRVKPARASALIDRYGEAIEADLHHWYGLDLLDFFTGRYSPRKLMVLIDGLPRTSHLRQAMSLDVELYRESKQQEREDGAQPPSPSPPLSEFSMEAEILAAVVDRLGEVIQATIAAAGSKKKIKIKPWPRPETAAVLERRRRRQEVMEHLEEVIRFTDE